MTQVEVKKKVTHGFVFQTYTGSRCTHQEFIASDDVQWEDEEGNCCGMPDHEYQAFDMVQPSNLEVEKSLVVSTGHITEADAKALERAAKNPERDLLVNAEDEWIMVHLDTMRQDDADLDNLSRAFHKMVKFGANRSEGFAYIKFDADGPVLEGFRVFDW
jgi:hypothetical protein